MNWDNFSLVDLHHSGQDLRLTHSSLCCTLSLCDHCSMLLNYRCHSTIAKVYIHSFIMLMFTHDNFTSTIQVDSVPCHDVTKEQFHWSK